MAAFCSSCGAQLEGDGHFCVTCGANQGAGAPALQAAAPPAPPQPAAFPPQPFAGMPPQYPPQYPSPPIMMGMPPTAPAKSGKWILIAIVVCAALYGFWYIGTHDKQSQTPTPQAQPGTPGPQGQPAAPGPQGQPATPAQPGTPGPQAQPGTPAQPGAPAPQPAPQAGANQALVAQQHFAGRWDPVNGYVQISQAQWQNASNVPMQSATLQCVQYAASGQTITQQQTTLKGPAQPGQIVTIPTFQMGQLAQGVAKVQCGIVGVTPAQ